MVVRFTHYQQYYATCRYNSRLLEQVMNRFVEDGAGDLLVATLCLIEVSQRGMLETELLDILADENNLLLKQTKQGML